jgi:DNA recombination protein RmuC
VGAEQNIILATPTTLIAILRAVAFSWKQEGLSRSAQEISRLGHDLYERLRIACEHWSRVGKSLNQSIEAYNQSVASLESRVLVSARKLKESCSIGKELEEPEPIDRSVRLPARLRD